MPTSNSSRCNELMQHFDAAYFSTSRLNVRRLHAKHNKKTKNRNVVREPKLTRPSDRMPLEASARATHTVQYFPRRSVPSHLPCYQWDTTGRKQIIYTPLACILDHWVRILGAESDRSSLRWVNNQWMSSIGVMLRRWYKSEKEIDCIVLTV